MKKILLFSLLLVVHTVYSQAPQHFSSTAIYNKIEKLNFLGTVLYVAAHPDDENTAMISYLSNKVHARVGYMALTRGDGGQNLIGPQMRELLGVIRTEELLAARRIDGGHQFFSRANDFGYSKNPEETFNFWDKKKVLGDLVYVIRKFQPDIIINRFDHRTPGTTHGHHTASAMLSVEAFDLTNDKTQYPNQLKTVQTWQPKAMFFNTNWWFFGSQKKFDETDKSNYFKVDVGSYFPMRGLSNTEISALSRSQHKSQGFGVEGKRGTDVNYLELVKGDFDVHSHSFFNGIDTTWNRIEGGAAIGKIMYQVQEDFNFKNPSASIPQLLKAYQLIKELKNDHWREIKIKEIKEIILDCAGIYLQSATSAEFATVNDKIELDIEAINRSNAAVTINSVSIVPALPNHSFEYNKELKNNADFKKTETLNLSKNLQPTSPYWLQKPHSLGMYTVDNQELIGLPKAPPQMHVVFNLTINGIPIDFTHKLVYKTATPTQGEVEKPFAIVPEVSVAMLNKTLIFADASPKTVKVDVKAYKDNISGTIRLKNSEGWKISPEQIQVELDKKGSHKTVEFTVTPPTVQNESYIFPQFLDQNGMVFEKELQIIDYPHINEQTVLLSARTKVIHFDIKKKGENIGYIIGAGDEVPQSLREIGYNVTLIDAKDITLEGLQKYDAVVVGIRAYDKDNGLVLKQKLLFEYVKQGGTVVNQYNTTRELKTDVVAPYKLELSHDRVTDENSKVNFLAPKHPLLNTPNKITNTDFEGWVQERGLYFPQKWSNEFTPILGMHDKGEKELKGSLLVAKYGEGYFIYTGLSFFRELPEGVSGAYRLFANMLSLGN